MPIRQPTYRGKSFLFWCFMPVGHTTSIPSTKLPCWASGASYFWPGRSKWNTVKGKNHPHNVDNAVKDSGRVWLHQDGQEDARKALFHEQFVPIRPVSAVFSAKNAYQATTLGLVSLGKEGLRDRQGWQVLLLSYGNFSQKRSHLALNGSLRCFWSFFS